MAVALAAAACSAVPPIADVGASGGGEGDVRLPDGRTVTAAAVASTCRPGDGGSWSGVGHYDGVDAPAPDRIYDVPLPAGGPHLTTPLPLTDGLAAQPLDVRGLVHNLEHGSVVVYVDPVAVGLAGLAEIDSWQRQLVGAGFAAPDARAGVFVSTVPRGAADVAPVSVRAWGVAIDCDRWDVAAADGVVASVYGERGVAPERALAPYPDDNGVIVGGPVRLPARATPA